MEKKKIIFIATTLAIVIFGVFVALWGGNSYGEFPSFHITSHYHPFEVERNFWHDATLVMTGFGEESDETADVRLRGRGNSTWVRGYDKRPLRLRFENLWAFEDEAHRDWVLISNHFDMSLMRNYAALYLGGLLTSMGHTPMVQNVHLYINGEYVGLYLLTDERDVAESRTNITRHNNPARSEYFFELDGHVVGWRADANTLGEDSFIADGLAYSIRFPSGRRLTTDHVDYLQDYVKRVGEAFRSHDLSGIKALIDIDSMIDFYIVQELFKNIDVAEFSVFMTIEGEGDNRRLRFGPVWDFDRSAGNTIHWHTHEHIFAGWYNIWFREALRTPELAELIIARWQEVQANEIPQMISHLRHVRTFYAPEFRRNSEVHQILADQPAWLHDMVPEHVRELTTWDAQADFFIQWLEKRVDWLNWYFEYFGEHDYS